MTGKKREFEVLFTKYKNYVYKICYQYSRSKEDALDLTQEVFIKVYKNIEKIKEGNGLKPWIRRITVNTCINYKRDKKETFSLECGDDGYSIKDTLKDTVSTENTVLTKLTIERLKTHINELQPEIKMAILLRHIKGLSYKEIASTMQSPEGTIKTYLYKGRQILLKKLRSEGILEVKGI